MALPNEPLTRAEQFLNRIATGEGTIPDEPLTRMEQYLDYIAKNGGSGGGGDPEAIASAVTDWLDDNVNPVGSAVVVDSSLSIAGAAADAEATGEAIKNAKSPNFSGFWTDGAFVDKTGKIITYNNYSYYEIPVFLFSNTTLKVKTNGVKNCGVAWYDETGTLINVIPHPTDGIVEIETTVPSNTRIVRFSCTTNYKNSMEYECRMPSDSMTRIFDLLNPKDKEVVRKIGSIEYDANTALWWNSFSISSFNGISLSKAIPIPGGAKVAIDGYGTNLQSAGYGFFNDSGEMIAAYQYTGTPEVVVAPENTAYLRFSIRDAVEPIVYYTMDSSQNAISLNTFTTPFIGLESLLSKCICIGDSTTNGGMGATSFPSRLANLTGWEVTNAGVNGATSTSWYKNEIGKYDFSQFQICVIDFGTNGGFTDTFDADVEAHSSYTDYADTAVGNYCKIIETIKAQNSDIIIVLSHPAKLIAYGRKIVYQIANKYNIPVIDLIASKYSIRKAGVMADDLHPNVVGYFMKAIAIRNGICEYLGNNPAKVLALM